MGADPKHVNFRPFPVRYFEKVEVRGDDDCWPWLAFRTFEGYGVIGIGDGSKLVPAHRMALFLETGQWPEKGQVVMHSCDHPWCQNPRHLSIGTDADNMRDRDRKGRSATGVRHGSQTHPESNHGLLGEEHHQAKLTADNVREIRASYLVAETQAELAKRFGVHQNQISRIVNRQSWRHIGNEDSTRHLGGID